MTCTLQWIPYYFRYLNHISAECKCLQNDVKRSPYCFCGIKENNEKQQSQQRHVRRSIFSRGIVCQG